MMITGTPEEQEAARRRILNRLKRAQGQLGAVIASMESGGTCREVVTQLAAVTSALDRAGFAIIASAMRDCVVDPDAVAEAEGLTSEELEKLLSMPGLAKVKDASLPMSCNPNLPPCSPTCCRLDK